MPVCDFSGLAQGPLLACVAKSQSPACDKKISGLVVTVTIPLSRAVSHAIRRNFLVCAIP